ncbi:hypothetical protein HB364_28330 [Pseudoflavitalea sp. X16]|uniref:hypothetical protein n=1 Tax=Paraflavitalea devenefica TaxID=2716334 RepID=UPI00142387FC|nr:hypothetical protein [Paraflavitalea devenefica]NII29019.1 hypothetical protein [Paraflavitalea devenefica]
MRKPNKEVLINILRKEVEEVFGQPITSYRECVLLSEEISRKTSYTINHNTLRRIYGLVKATYPPSTTTLAILARYCGYDSLEELVEKKQQTDNAAQNFSPQDILSYISAVFKNTPVRDSHDPTFAALVKQTVIFLQDHSLLSLELLKKIARTKNGQDYYFEQFIHIDELNSLYGEGLRYYMNEKQTISARIFGHSLLCLRDWLTGNPKDVKKHSDIVNTLQPPKYAHPFLSGIYYAALILDADIQKTDNAQILLDAAHAHAGLAYFEGTHAPFPWFEYIFCIALVLTGQNQEALYYLDNIGSNKENPQQIIEEGRYETLLLLRGIALVKTGRRAEAKDIYETVKPHRFHFLSKKFDTMLYLTLGILLQKINPKVETQLDRLIKETGFVKMQGLGGNMMIGMNNTQHVLQQEQPFNEYQSQHTMIMAN